MIRQDVIPTSDTREIPGWLSIAVLAAAIIFFAVRNLPWHLDDFDQAKQAYVSFEMVNENHWLYQHTPTGRIATKPPLAGWISAGLALPFAQGAKAPGGESGGATEAKQISLGVWQAAWRLPVFACAIAMLWLVWRAGRQLGGEVGGVMASGALGFNLMSPRVATLVRTDEMLCFLIFLAGWTVWRRIRAGGKWTTAERLQIFLIVLASMLVKGPIAYAFLLPGLAAFWILQRKGIEPGQAWSGWWSWFGPLLIFGAWAAYGIATSQEFYQEVVQKEFLGRFTVGENAVHHNQPLWFYLANVLHKLFPWSLALFGLAWLPEVRTRVRRDPELLWLACWAIGGLVFMSCVPSKRADRIFPVLPPLCLLLAGCAPLVPRERLRCPARKVVLALCVAALISSGGYTAARLIESHHKHQGALADFGVKARATAAPGRLAVVSGKDEGMLLYTNVLHFTELKDAMEQWEKGAIDAVVLPLGKRQKDAVFEGRARVLVSEKAEDKFSRYECLVRGRKAAE